MAKQPENPADFSKTGTDLPKTPADFAKAFADFDFTKLLGDLKLPGIDMEAAAAWQRRNVEVLAEANKLAIEGAQAVFKRQVEILRQSLDEASGLAREAFDAATPHDKAIRQTELLKDAFERALGNARELSDIIAKSNGEALELINRRFAQSLDELKESLVKAKTKS